MLIGCGVDLPAAVVTAHKGGRLVIFAGAGVSMSSPANLPDFNELATRVGHEAGSSLDLEKNKPADRFFGLLKAGGTDVHRAVRTILTNPSSAPTPLHESLILLFGSVERVRIVTTNFDPHFTTTARAAYGVGLPIYYAPALPQGHRFRGLVYLHGSVEQDPSEMILTDSDFGRAYLTEGWARRFLQEMFSTFTVLFVGYSHGDPIVTYLARGLPPNTARYAFHIDDDAGPWQHLGICGIPYAAKEEPDRHGTLRDAVAQWLSRTRMGYADHESRIQGLVAGQPPLPPEDADDLKSYLAEEPTARLFARYATRPIWLHWCVEEKLLQPLFSRDSELSKPMAILARWFADCFVANYPDDALTIVQRMNHVLNPRLWLEVARRCATTHPKVSDRRLSQWVGILLRNVPESWGDDRLEEILSACQHPGDELTAVALFEHLTRPRLQLEPTFGGFAHDGEPASQLRFSVVLACQGYELREAWKNLFLPHVSAYTPRLAPILTAHLQRAHDLLRSVDVASDGFDPLSLHRTAIEPHSQDRYPNAFDTVIDAARDVLECIVAEDGERARALVTEWAAAEAPLLRRLAVHGMARLASVSADQKLRWLLGHEWLFAHPLKHEVFQFLRTVYPSGSIGLQRRVLRAAERGRKSRDRSAKARRTARYETFNLLYWLTQIAPNSDVTMDRFRGLTAKHPDFAPRPHPDADIWSEVEWVGHHPPITAEAMLQRHPSELVDFFLKFLRADPDFLFGGGPEDLVREIGLAVARSNDWGWQLVEVLDQRGLWETAIWQGVLAGWRDSALDASLVKQVIEFVASHPIVSTFADEISDFLEEVGKRALGVLTDATLQAGKDLTRDVWSVIDLTLQQQHVGSDDWLIRSINTPAGSLVSFWIQVISTQRHRAGDNWNALSEGDREFFDHIVDGPTLATRLGRVALTSQLPFLYAVDRDWTRARVLPLLDWDTDSETATQAWQGFLTWGILSPGLVEDLLPLYEKGFGERYQRLGERRNEFIGHVAAITIHLQGVSLPGHWLSRFIATASAQDRTIWAQKVDDALQSLTEDARYDVWQRWLKDYWERRLRGSPVPLDAEEIGAMTPWAFALPMFFPEVVALACQSPPPANGTEHALHRLANWDKIGQHPQAVADLLLFILTGYQGDFWYCPYAETIVSKLPRSGVSPTSFTGIRDQLVRLGCVGEIAPSG